MVSYKCEYSKGTLSLQTWPACKMYEYDTSMLPDSEYLYKRTVWGLNFENWHHFTGLGTMSKVQCHLKKKSVVRCPLHQEEAGTYSGSSCP